MWELISFAKSEVRRRCLELLYDSPKTPSGIANMTNMHLSHVSRALRELDDKGLVRCETPFASKNRIYQITDRGREVYLKVIEIK